MKPVGGFDGSPNSHVARCVAFSRDRGPRRHGLVHLPMRRRRDAAALPERDRLASDLPAGDLPGDGALDCADQSSDRPPRRHQPMPASAGLRHLWKLPVAAGLSLSRWRDLKEGSGTVGWVLPQTLQSIGRIDLLRASQLALYSAFVSSASQIKPPHNDLFGRS